MSARTAWLRAIWRQARRMAAPGLGHLPAVLPAPFTGNAVLRPIIGVLPVRDCIGDDGHESFEVIPLAEAHRRDWRLILAVCDGQGMEGDPFHAARNADMAAEMAMIDHTFAQLLPMQDTRYIVDLVAIHPRRPHLPRLIGSAEALGDATGRLARRGMVWVARDLADWAAQIGRRVAVLPIGTPAERLAYLRQCEALAVTSTAEAEALQRRLVRPPPPLPQIFVAAA